MEEERYKINTDRPWDMIVPSIAGATIFLIAVILRLLD